MVSISDLDGKTFGYGGFVIEIMKSRDAPKTADHSVNASGSSSLAHAQLGKAGATQWLRHHGIDARSVSDSDLALVDGLVALMGEADRLGATRARITQVNSWQNSYDKKWYACIRAELYSLQPAVSSKP